jgi:quercetin dioxygenase-like cupin family protein
MEKWTRTVRRGSVGAGLLLATGLSFGVVQAQLANVSQQLVAKGRLDSSPLVNGPADVYLGTITLPPGASYGGWHTHPGPVWVVVTQGELARYGPDGCRTRYPAGSAYQAQPNSLYDLRNETTAPLELAVSGIIPADQPPTIPVPAARFDLLAPYLRCGG